MNKDELDAFVNRVNGYFTTFYQLSFVHCYITSYVPPTLVYEFENDIDAHNFQMHQELSGANAKVDDNNPSTVIVYK